MRFVLVAWLLLQAPPAAAADGPALYAEHCGGCHGADGRADTPVAKAMRAPALTGREWSAETVAAVVRGSALHRAASDELDDAALAAVVQALAALPGA